MQLKLIKIEELQNILILQNKKKEVKKKYLSYVLTRYYKKYRRRYNRKTLIRKIKKKDMNYYKIYNPLIVDSKIYIENTINEYTENKKYININIRK